MLIKRKYTAILNAHLEINHVLNLLAESINIGACSVPAILLSSNMNRLVLLLTNPVRVVSMRVKILHRFASSDSTYGYTDVSNTTYTITSLTAGLEYYIRVSSRNTIGYSGFCELSGNSCAGEVVSTIIS